MFIIDLMRTGPSSTNAIITCVTPCHRYMRRRRTVSFSDYIDSTLFRNNDTITKMHNSLKNKRKNRRRKDQRKTSKDGRIVVLLII